TKAAELLGKRHALFTDKQQIEVTEMPVFVDDIGDDDG
ncbi:terminase small subunit, partial [Streptococcus pyogenes]